DAALERAGAHREELLRQARRQVALAVRHRLDGGDDLGGRLVFQRVAVRAGGERLEDELVRRVHRQHQDLGLGREAPELFYRGEAGRPGEPYVVYGDAGLETSRDGAAAARVGCITDDSDPRIVVEDRAETVAEKWMIIDDDDADAHDASVGQPD